MLRRREDDEDGSEGKSGPSKTAIIVVVSLAIVFSIIVLLYLILRTLRTQYPRPTYVPTHFLKKKWELWKPGSFTSSKGSYSARLQNRNSAPTLRSRDEVRSARLSGQNLPDLENGNGPETSQAQNGVDRNTSVRSVMTLPAYSRSVRENERILGREGDREGMDMVVEHAETGEEEESRRDSEMESLYQIRVQRQRETAEREDRRTARRDARARGDTVTLERLREEARLHSEAATLTGAQAMMAEHRSRSRERRISSVSYGDLGVARHDGTRLRAGSNDSDSRPLLDSAASIAGGTAASIRPLSAADSHRGRSASPAYSRRSRASNLDLTSTAADVEATPDVDPPPFGRSGSAFEAVSMHLPPSHSHSRPNSTSHSPFHASRSASPSRSLTRPSIDTQRLDAAPAHRTSLPFAPPDYEGEGFEDAPPYTSPVEARAGGGAQGQGWGGGVDAVVEGREGGTRPQSSASASGAPMLPGIERLPSIRIADPTPVEAREGVEWPAPGTGATTGRER